ncbi:hypothetical protein [Azospirillum sp. B506]|uniref:hypothetical protein n=1 Tax=Azospirillum sp. B506 TaxID=137721 RepID=UPI0003497B2F|nr:hypothetical protein [Azospirillum sp. B506]
MSRLLILSLTLATIATAPAFAASPSLSDTQTLQQGPASGPPGDQGRALNPQPLPP